MKDLQKLRKGFEKKLKLAEIENEMEEKYGCEFMAIGHLFNDGAHIIAKTDELSVAARLLNDFPADKERPLDASATNPKGGVFGLYKAGAERGFRDTYTKLKISWFHKGDEFEFELKIDGNELLEQFFINDQRKMADFERDTYKPTRRGHIVRDMDLPIKRFLCDQIAYQGGYRSATEPERIMDIINAIKEVRYE